MSRYRFIEVEKANHAISLMCWVLTVSRAGYYSWRKRGRSAPVAPNLVAQNFVSGAPDRLWFGDITYVPTQEGWLYLATLMDCYARRIVGWSMADHLRTELALSALDMAIRRRRPRPGELVHHTDRGCQYTSAAYQTALVGAGITASMSRKCECLDNAVAESFFATLKAELIEGRTWRTRAEAAQAIFEWIEVFYNRQRLHSALGYSSPNTKNGFEQRR